MTTDEDPSPLCSRTQINLSDSIVHEAKEIFDGCIPKDQSADFQRSGTPSGEGELLNNA